MPKIKKEELDEMLKLHAMWQKNKMKGKRIEIVGADFRGLDLCGMSMAGAVLPMADFSGVNLRWTKLMRADLRMSDFTNADLRKSNLQDAILNGACFSGTKLGETKMRKEYRELAIATGADATAKHATSICKR